jgi:hypothetical protein
MVPLGLGEKGYKRSRRGVVGSEDDVPVFLKLKEKFSGGFYSVTLSCARVTD